MTMQSPSEPVATEHSPATDCHRSNWKRQFGHPTGRLGRVTGWLMGVKNAPMHRFAVETLNVQPDDAVLEIGFGHGKMIALLAAGASSGLVAGVDPSGVMLDQATRRNRRAIAEGRVQLHGCDASQIPYDDGSFDVVCEANTFHHWPSVKEGLREVRRILKPGGTLLLCIRGLATGRFQFSPGYSPEQIEETKAVLERNGFRDIRSESTTLDREITCVLATR